MFGPKPRAKVPGEVGFYPLNADELCPDNMNAIQLFNLGLGSKHTRWLCGACGAETTGRVLCDLVRQQEGSHVAWCVCACERAEPTIFVSKEGKMIAQLPQANEFPAGHKWPNDLRTAFEEAGKSFAVGAYTASAMMCRKILMVCACDKGAKEGDGFAYYVDYITDSVLQFPDARAAIRKIRDIGTDATHELKIISQSDARTAMEIAAYVMGMIYSLPGMG